MLDQAPGGTPLWVFGYGSLMWRPGFEHHERQGALLRGYHRALCVASFVHRGTPEQPGLVLGLDRGGSCRGVAFRAVDRDATLAYLKAREQVTGVYVEMWPRVLLDDGRRVEAVAYRADRAHPQYRGRLTDEDAIRLVRQGVGVSGANPDYVLATQEHLVALGIRDPLLTRLAGRLGEAGA